MVEHRIRFEAGGDPQLRLRPDAIEAIPSEQYPTPAKRPANSMLDNGKLIRTLGLELLDWRECLGIALEEMAT